MTISNYDDVIDSRDIIERIEELESEIEELRSEYQEATEDHEIEEAQDAVDAWVEENKEELDALKALQEEAEGYCDWADGTPLIRGSYFTEYAIDMLKDCGTLPSDIPWYIVIDEEATAENIKVDYTEVDFDGITYYVR